MIIKKSKVFHDFNNGNLTGENVLSYRKKYKDISHIYEYKDNSINSDTIMYEVSSLDSGGKNTLLWGVTTLHPVLVKNECNMTRGHFHNDRLEPEIYYGILGKGLLMLMNDNSEVFCEEISPGSIHYIDGKFAHRLINCGDEILKVGACWSKNAGHDYHSIEQSPFSSRVFKRDKEMFFEDLNMKRGN